MGSKVEETEIEPKISYSNTMLNYQFSRQLKFLGELVV